MSRRKRHEKLAQLVSTFASLTQYFKQILELEEKAPNRESEATKDKIRQRLVPCSFPSFSCHFECFASFSDRHTTTRQRYDECHRVEAEATHCEHSQCTYAVLCDVHIISSSLQLLKLEIFMRISSLLSHTLESSSIPLNSALSSVCKSKRLGINFLNLAYSAPDV